MHISKVLVAAAMATAAVGVIAGCSGSGSSSLSSVVPSSHGVRQAASIHDSGVAPKYLESIRFGGGLPAVRPNSGGKTLAVSDAGTNTVDLFNGSYVQTGTISNGLSGPDGEWFDQAGNLYVGNFGGTFVQEYAPGGSSPSFNYTTSLTDPINETTDEAGNVYVDDYQGDQVVEFAQASNTPLHACSVAGAPEGIAVGEHGKVFVSLNFTAGGAGIVEFPAGLSSCGNEVTLISSLGFAGGLQLDSHNNLVACDQLVGVDIIKKPNYNSISSTITGASDSFHVALNKYSTLVFIADPANFDVLVDKYPSGTPVTTITGFSTPYGVATKPFQH